MDSRRFESSVRGYLSRVEQLIAQCRVTARNNHRRRRLILDECAILIEECHELVADPACLEEMRRLGTFEIWGSLFERLEVAVGTIVAQAEALYFDARDTQPMALAS